jgi:hypothetical protein
MKNVLQVFAGKSAFVKARAASLDIQKAIEENKKASDCLICVLNELNEKENNRKIRAINNSGNHKSCLYFHKPCSRL